MFGKNSTNRFLLEANMEIFTGKYAKIAYKFIESSKPIIFFNHGAHKTLQNISYWKPLEKIIVKYCSPVFIDAPEHGSSEFLHGNNKVIAISEFINHFMGTHENREFGIIGRSAGARISVHMLENMKYLGLIAPAGVNITDIQKWEGNISILWDMQDPVISFENIKQFKMYSLFIVGKPKFPVTKYVEASKPGSHIPEIEYPDLFEQFLTSVISY